ncbi:MAG TPA: Na+/H+ antiporter NhaA [Coxiellaceae bacterium]|nr:MAG: Na(+)/H(+) antiporter NhaA [Gammaproteobacteria bacterium RIFCSPHIGHO2_12_FULL_36_30]HLB56379.1 Na+/H+ antiporter NhaA [Coxiellaceae bacterium]
MPLRSIREFIKLESSAGVILVMTALLAIIVDNSSFANYYHSFFYTPIKISFGNIHLEKPILLWINDGFMTIFFLLIGLEIKREMLEGELNSISKISLPAITALGGMIGPAAIYLFINWHDPIAIKGWAIPIATDTAFSLAILSLLGNKIPVSLKIFLTAFAIFDDIGAIIIMAVFYSTDISFLLLLCALLLICILALFNYLEVKRLGPYFFIGFILWLCVLNSGVHATLAGIVLAFFIPLKNKKNPDNSPLRRLEKKLHPWVAFCILPIFAFANAGVSFLGITPAHLLSSVPLGIALGLFFGKQIGIWLAATFAVKMGVSRLPSEITYTALYGVALIAGVGFTMSLFIGTLAFHSVAPYSAYVRIGVLFGSLCSGFLGYLILRAVYTKK